MAFFLATNLLFSFTATNHKLTFLITLDSGYRYRNSIGR